MAITVDELIVEIKTDTRDLQRGLEDVKKKLGSMEASTNKSLFSFKKLAGVLGAIGFAKIASDVISTSRTFEDLEATLKAITGSAEGAAASMALINKFTATTTFQLESVTSAFTTLLNAGITPTSDVLQDFGNVAAAFNKDITVMAQAAFNATTGEMEMLKQFGIIAKVQGDKLSVTFDNTTTTIERNSTSIIDYIRKIGSEKFPTALEERSKTVSGAFSNLADATSLLYNSVGESGLNEALTSLALGLIDVVNSAKPMAEAFGRGIKRAFELLGNAINFAKQYLDQLIDVIIVYTSYQLARTTLQAGQAFIGLAKSIAKARVAFAALNKVSKGNIIVVAGILIAGLTGNLDIVTEKILEFGNALAEITGIKDLLGDISAGTEEVEASLAELDANLVSVVGASASAGAGLDAVKKNAELVKEEMDSLKDSITSATQAMTGEFVDSLMEGESALESFKNFAKSIVSQIISTFINLMVVNKILNGIFNLGLPMKDFPFGGGGGGAGPITRSPITNNPISVSSGIPATGAAQFVRGNAGGGNANSGSPYLVGERGPEMFIPNSGGRIVNGHNTNNMMGGGGVVVNQTINLSAGVVGTVRSEVQRMMPQIANITKAGVLEATRRGGTYRRGLLGS